MHKSFGKLLFGLSVATLGLIVTTLTVPSDAKTSAKTNAKTSAKTQPQPPPADDHIDQWTHLDQHWDQKMRRDFYGTSQGSQLMPYDWFMSIEAPGSQKPFAQNLERYGFLAGYTDQSDKLPS